MKQTKETSENKNRGKTSKSSGKSSGKSANNLLWNAFWPGLVLACIVVPALPIFGGCAYLIKPPEPEAAPTPVPTIYVNPDEYKPRPEAEATNIKALTDNNPDTPTADYYEIVGADAGDLLTLQAWRLTKDGTPFIAPLDKPIRVKLGGVISPLPGEPGWAEARQQVLSWLGGRRLQVDEDAKYPVTVEGRNIVQIRIMSKVKKGAPPNVTEAEEERPFNQLLVRAGYAFVDLVTPTSFNYREWIIDEEYARGVRKEPAPWQLQNHPAGQPTPTPVPGIPAGLWARGIHPPFRRDAVVRQPKTEVIGADPGGPKTKSAPIPKAPPLPRGQTATGTTTTTQSSSSTVID